MKKLLALLLVFFLATPVLAVEELTPEMQVKKITDAVLEIVRNDTELQKNGNTGPATQLIDERVLQPHFNFLHMTKLGLGREWRKASPAQQDALVKEFKTLLVNTYSNALTIYKDPTVNFKTSRYKATDTDVMIRTQVLQTGIAPVDIDYNVEKLGNEWKVYDVVVAGVSLVTNYRQFFSQEVRKGGIEGAIKSLQAKNQTQGKK
ncbi:MAG: ABC transporter substrate-binding protein [Desulfobulbaceae bacterium]|nr:ABC transporter substrate-binding protein [Desulfobulbaceae bacterium]